MTVARAGRGPHRRNLLRDMRGLSLLGLFSVFFFSSPSPALAAPAPEGTPNLEGSAAVPTQPDEGGGQPTEQSPSEQEQQRELGRSEGAYTAGEEGDLQSVYRDGEQAYREGDYARAVQLFQRVYRYRPHPNILFNIARCFEELRSYEEAIGFYEDYLSKTPEGEERDQVAQSVRALKALNLQELRAEGRRRWRWGAYGGAVLLYGVAAGFAIATASTRSELDDATSTGMSPARYKELQARGATQAAWADGLVLLGSGALSLGLYLQFSGDSPAGAPSAESGPSAWHLSIGPGTLRISF